MLSSNDSLIIAMKLTVKYSFCAGLSFYMLQKITSTEVAFLTSFTIGVLGFNSQWELGIFLFTIMSRTALGSTQPPVQWVPGTLSLGVKWPGCEADHSPPSSAKVK
jgi:hypothetical protein